MYVILRVILESGRRYPFLLLNYSKLLLLFLKIKLNDSIAGVIS